MNMEVTYEGTQTREDTTRCANSTTPTFKTSRKKRRQKEKRSGRVVVFGRKGKMATVKVEIIIKGPITKPEWVLIESEACR